MKQSATATFFFIAIITGVIGVAFFKGGWVGALKGFGIATGLIFGLMGLSWWLLMMKLHSIRTTLGHKQAFLFWCNYAFRYCGIDEGEVRKGNLTLHQGDKLGDK